MDTLCIYTYYEKNDTYKKNCEYFIENGMNDKSEYLFVINGNSTIDFSRYNTIYRENKGYDWGAYTQAIRSIDINKYKYFIFINTSIIGPCSYFENWQSSFTDLIKGDVKLVGPYISIYCENNNCNMTEKSLAKFKDLGFDPPFNHVSCPIFATDQECLLYLKDSIFVEDERELEYIEMVYDKEVKMSLLVLKNNWNISCLAKRYQGHDYRTLKTDINPTSLIGVAFLGPNQYFGENISPEEVIFIKTSDPYYHDDVYIQNLLEKNNDISILFVILVIIILIIFCLSVFLR